jgi:hypothetical protein
VRRLEVIVKLKMDMKVRNWRKDGSPYGHVSEGLKTIPEGNLLKVLCYDRSRTFDERDGIVFLQTLDDGFEIRMNILEFNALTEDVGEKGV